MAREREPESNGAGNGADELSDRAAIEVRALRAQEIALAHAIERRSYPPAEAASLARLADRRARFPEGTLGLFERGRLRAFLSAVRTDLEELSDPNLKAEGGHEPHGHHLVVLSVCTLPAHRCRGFAARLLLAAYALAKGLQLASVRLLCKEALIPFYERQGYRLRGPSCCSHGGARWFEMVQELE